MDCCSGGTERTEERQEDKNEELGEDGEKRVGDIHPITLPQIQQREDFHVVCHKIMFLQLKSLMTWKRSLYLPLFRWMILRWNSRKGFKR